MSSTRIIGVLALQGNWRHHISLCHRLGVDCVAVHALYELERCSGLIIPGGESTVMAQLLTSGGLLGALRQAVRRQFPILGCCAGAILLAKQVLPTAPHVPTLSAIDMVVQRNAYGRQIYSAMHNISLFDTSARALFIRAPKIISVGSEVVVIATKSSPQSATAEYGTQSGALIDDVTVGYGNQTSGLAIDTAKSGAVAPSTTARSTIGSNAIDTPSAGLPVEIVAADAPTDVGAIGAESAVNDVATSAGAVPAATFAAPSATSAGAGVELTDPVAVGTDVKGSMVNGAHCDMLGVRQGNCMAVVFHPEESGLEVVHRRFISDCVDGFSGMFADCIE